MNSFIHSVISILTTAILSAALIAAPLNPEPVRKSISRVPNAWRIPGLNTTGPAKVVIEPEHKAFIELVDQKTGRYRLVWTREDQAPRELIYYLPDRVNAVVRATVGPGSRQAYEYIYEVLNRNDSGQDLFGIAIQTFASKPLVFKAQSDYITKMRPTIPEFSTGDWYWVTYPERRVPPGTLTRVEVESDDPPGLVQIRVHGGPLVIKGIGEEPPAALLDALPGFSSWPTGITIGPVHDARAATYPFATQDFNQILELMRDAGWIAHSSESRYTDLIRRNAWSELSETVARDAENGEIASEAAVALQRVIPTA